MCECVSLDLDCGSTFNTQSGAGRQVDLAGQGVRNVPVVHLPVGVTLITPRYEIIIMITPTCNMQY